jgi:protease IV
MEIRDRNPGRAVARRPLVVGLFVGIVGFMTLAGIVLAISRSVRGDDGLGFRGRIALLEIDGIITDDAPALRQIRRYRRDSSVRGYVVAINSPGGIVGPSQSIFQELKRLRDEDDVPVVASIGGIGASGGYYVALGADSIFALPGSITGSIGVIMELPDASALMERVGIRFEVVKSAEHKDVGSPFRPISPEDREILSAMVQDVYDQFVAVVVDERGLSRAAVEALADGRIVSGRQALAGGLIDRLGNLEDAVSAAGQMAGLGPRPRIVRPPEPRVTIFDLILGGASMTLDRFVRPLEEAAMPRVKFVVPW